MVLVGKVLPGGSDHIEPACNAQGLHWISGSGRSLSLEKGKANHFNILDWRTLWTEKQWVIWGFPSDTGGNLPDNAGDIRDAGSIPGSGRSPGGGHSNPLQYSPLENPMDRGSWCVTAHRVIKSQRWLKGLSTDT